LRTGTAGGVGPPRRLKVEIRIRRGKLLDASEYRRILGHWVTGVAVVTARAPDGHRCGLTANAVTSLSLDPPLVLVCVERNSDTHGCILASGHLAVSMLRQDQERLARRFAASEGGEKFAGIAFREEQTGAPVLEDVLAWVDCRLWRTYEGGDHTIFVAEILAGDAQEGAPLVFYRSGFGRVTP